MSPSTERLIRLLAEAEVPAERWRKAFRLGFAHLRGEVNLHPTGAAPSAVLDAAAVSSRSVAGTCLPMGLGLVMHLYPLCALQCMPLPWWSPGGRRRARLLREVHRNGWILANAGSERAAGAQAPVRITRTEHGVCVNGIFDYVSLANVANVVMFSAPLQDAEGTIFCAASIDEPSVSIGPSRFTGSMKLSDTCSLTFTDHVVPPGRFIEIPGATALSCMSQYQRSWFHLLLADTYQARIEALRSRWNVPTGPEDLASRNELALMRDHATRLLDDAAGGDAAIIAKLSRVTAALKLRTSWMAKATAVAVQPWDPSAARELAFIERQPTSDDRILRSLQSPQDAAIPTPAPAAPIRLLTA